MAEAEAETGAGGKVGSEAGAKVGVETGTGAGKGSWRLGVGRRGWGIAGVRIGE